ncbi:MAG TPA: mobile mystery protein B [Rhizomicrobium sp.]|jgi:Fic-DOC domain mobile mystery protein B|nr:mobile mystery protein B [Rhizomicrobium sp.]
MVGRFHADEAGTPLDPQEREGLIPTYITTREQLNEAEAKNILAAISWAFMRKRDMTDEAFLRGLHRRMLNRVWRWAGKYRKTERNLGVAPHRIPVELRALLDTMGYWLAHETYPPDELAVRFHHGLVVIHPFANGNGRWSRLAADILVVRLGCERFSWGSGVDLRSPGADRDSYIGALRAADDHDFGPLIAFARS